jgi:predicted PurR-regulated permease PerM
VSDIPTKPVPAKPSTAKPSIAKPSTVKPLASKSPPTKPLPGERQPPYGNESTPVPDSKTEMPPLIRRTEVVAIALVGLLIICIIAGLYLAKAFFLPITMAFIVGTMLSPAAGFLERCRIPRAVAAVLIVAAAGAGATFMVGMIASPAVEWSGKLPELGAMLKEKLHVFDRPLALWQELQSMLGGPGTLTTLHLPKFDWVQPTLEFLSPTFAEFLLFIATLILFIGWRDLRRALIMNFGERTARLRTLRMLNRSRSIWQLPLDGDHDQRLRRRRRGPICAVWACRIRVASALAAIQFHPDHRPGGVRRLSWLARSRSQLGAGLLAPALFAAMTFLEGHFLTPMIVGRRLALNALAVFIALAFWTWLWGPMGAFLSSPLLIVALIVKEHLMPSDAPQLPED